MTSLTRLLLSAVLVAAACVPVNGHAGCSNEYYSFDFLWLSSNESGTSCTNDVGKLYDMINDDAFTNVVSTYNGQGEAQANINFNGLPINVRIGFFSDIIPDNPNPNPNNHFVVADPNDNDEPIPLPPPPPDLPPTEDPHSNAFDLSIPALKIQKTFNGSTRNESANMLVDYIRNNEDIQKWIAKNTPNSPITSPGGLIHNAGTVDFAGALYSVLDNGGGVSFTASSGRTRVNGRKADTSTLPLSHSWHSGSNRGKKFTMSGSLTQVRLASATTYQGSIATAYRLPVTKRWALTPSLGYAVSHSTDLSAATGLVSMGLSSTYHIPFSKLDFVIGNMVGYHQTTKAIGSKNSFDPDITSWSIRNGAMLAQPVNFFGVPLSLEYSAVDTRYVGGTKFYVDNTQEIGISIGTNRRADVSKKFTRVGLRYLHGRDTNSVSVSGGYWF